MRDHVLSCTFCKRSEHQVRKLVAGPGVYICDRCTQRAHAIIQGGAPPPSPGSFWRRRSGQLRRLFAARTTKREIDRLGAHAVQPG